MKLIISPAKKMTVNLDDFDYQGLPVYLKQTRQLLAAMRQLSITELQQLWRTSDRLTQLNFDQLQKMDLTKRLTPAILSFTGIQYQSMAPGILTSAGLAYLQKHLRILSGFYGILKPFDGIVPYRLEMQARLSVDGHTNLYTFWGDRLYQALQVSDDHEPIINLASQEYAKAIKPFLKSTDTFVEIKFGQLIGGQFKVRATRAKMARGEMVHFIAKNQLTNIAGIKDFDSPNYRYSPTLSTHQKMVFIEK